MNEPANPVCIVSGMIDRWR